MKKYFKLFLILIISLLVVGCGKTEKKEVKKKEPENVASSKVGSFVSYDNDIYYWKLNKDSRDKEAYLGSPNDLPDAVNELVKVDSKGKETVVLKDTGSSELVISNNKIYTSNTVDDAENDREIFSVDLDGKNKKEIGNGFISDIVKNRYIYGLADRYNGGIFMIDSADDEYKIIKEKAKINEVKDDVVYYSDNSARKSVVIGSIKDNEDQGELMSVSATDFEYADSVTVLEVERMECIDGKLEIYIGYRDGSANLIQELKKYTYELDSGKIETEDVEILDEEPKLTRNEVYISYNNSSNNIVYKNDNKEENIISIADLANKYEMEDNEETSIDVYKGNVVDDNVYFIIDYGKHDSEKDVGWRYAYNREKTIYFKYSIKDKSLKKLLEF